MSDPTKAPTAIVVLGVSGSGKTTIASALADSLDLDFRDADDLHSPANRAKMAAGQPLTDSDRRPWLDAVGGALARSERGVVIACSALRRVYRDRLREACPRVRFVHLDGDQGLLLERLNARADHFMPPELLQSQFDTLEPLEPDESGFVVDVTPRPEEILATIRARLGAVRVGNA
ncbi:gluconokinase [Pseudactinotalea sp. HY158]|uniref:gluconokinase n=1 Tax=Pseudactinotalea sp. HY158 TaxID=2654547 RepID=UPI00129C1BFB|nr:gluconokinase [Pseudactinotalea sp. HY158]QGH69103.1 AAA family ATPase [Pseudactinotalea sp. HY158]